MRLSSTSTGKDAALDAAHSLKTDTDSKLYGMGVGKEMETSMEIGNAKTTYKVLGRRVEEKEIHFPGEC